MLTIEKVSRLVEEKIKGSQMYLVDVKISATNKITVEIDSDSGISIQDCVEVSRFVEQNLDREEEDFELQVSSPGLSQAFKIFRQYNKNIGKNVEVLLKNGEKLEGALLSAKEDEGIVLEIEERIKDEKTKKKKTIRKVHSLDFEQIKETKIVISFK
jgi:ribosome maturation factor RimP